VTAPAETVPAGTAPAGRAPVLRAAAVLVWIPTVLLVDRGASLGSQRLFGLCTWVLLAFLLWFEDPMTRLQVGVVVAYATLVEYTFAGGLGVYVYRLEESGVAHAWYDQVPAFVPPGHGLVYLAAVLLGRRAPPIAVPAAVAGVSAYALWGLTLSPRRDVLGALWAACLVWFLLRGRAPRVYASAFLVVTYLEIVGTSLGTWAWQSADTVTGWIAIGNPPSGAAGGYCFFDAAALTIAPLLLRQIRRRRRRRPEPESRPEPTAVSA
jgi:hypothetical protein